jgi:alkanesulfonate monooxygenase SsuD/methylene tetrahydromethanopterin reductase-like flavin-dependent oxidoreductase (luciferase family)
MSTLDGPHMQLSVIVGKQISMRFGVSMPNAGDPAQLVELAVIAEDAGWDGFFLWDHLQLDAVGRPPMHDPWVLLGAIAARTSRVRLGTMVTPVARRRPWKLAKEIATLDHLSVGRVIVGVGLGVPAETEYGAFGEPMQARLHAAMLDEALPLLDAFLRGEPVDHDGGHYQVTAHLNPPAHQRPRPPIWVAATLPHAKPVARARRWDGIFPLDSRSGPPSADALAQLVSTLDPPAGYDVVGTLTPELPVADLARAGATWAMDGPAGPAEPFADVRARIQAGPLRLR